MIIHLTHSRPEISTIVSYAGTKNSSPTIEDFGDLLLAVEYLWSTKQKGLILNPAEDPNVPLTLVIWKIWFVLRKICQAKVTSNVFDSRGDASTFYFSS